jgi:hypothetical protein
MTNELVGIIAIIITMLGGFLAFGISFGGLKMDVRNLKHDVDKHDRLLEKLVEDISFLKGTIVYKGNSPIQQTESGKMIFSKVNGEEFVSKHKTEIAKFVEENSNTDYDVQENSILSIEKFATDEEMVKFKNFAYKDGWKLDDIYQVIGLRIRDGILNKI